MMTTPRHGGHSRPGSSRATSVARELMKRRDKPFKTEKQKVLTKRKKLELHTSYKMAPAGYRFVPVGTPDLSAKCKELSRQGGFPVNVVNATSGHKFAIDPDKLSHHVHRIGYHFKAEVVAQACEELGYVTVRDHFVKETDLQEQHQQSHIARILAQYGVHVDPNTTKETTDQVRAAIKELFPKIPDEDLNQIVEHAWKEGSHRVGTNSDLELSRRVQLATIARIRHTYTDYDQLLRAFEWREARSITEQECLKKLIEWRGENDVEEDNELEEIVRETIVLDDEEEEANAPNLVSEADDEHSDLELGDASDASIEVTHHIAADEDFGMESVDERSTNFLRRFQPRSLRTEQQNNIARQKIEAARQLLRNAPPPQPSEVRVVNVATDERGHPPTALVVDGVTYHLAPLEPAGQLSAPRTIISAQRPTGYSPQYPGQSQPSNTPLYAGSYQQLDAAHSSGHIMPSIEPTEPTAPLHLQTRPYITTSRTAEHSHAEKRQRIGHSPNHLRPGPHQNYQSAYTQPSYPSQTRYEPQPGNAVIDLTGSDRRSRSENPSPMRDVQESSPRPLQNARYINDQRAFSGSALWDRPSMATPAGPQLNDYRTRQVDPEPYDPTRPLMQFSEHGLTRRGQQDFPRPHEENRAMHPQSGPQYSALPTQYHASGYPPPTTHPPALATSYQPPNYRQQPHSFPHPLPFPPAPLMPHLVHGAPALVQQASHDARNTPASNAPNHPAQGYVQSTHSPPSQPIIGAPHPAQYYQPR